MGECRRDLDPDVGPVEPQSIPGGSGLEDQLDRLARMKADAGTTDFPPEGSTVGHFPSAVRFASNMPSRRRLHVIDLV
jgi:hypothetical protein